MMFFSSGHWLAITLQILYLITTVSGVIVVIAGNRNPVKTLAWILLFFLLPFLSIVFYLFFGMDYTRQRLISRKKRRKLINLHAYPTQKSNQDVVLPEYSTLSKYLNHLNQYPISTQNELTIFDKGKLKFEQLLIDIDNAEREIHIEYYIIEADEIGNRLKEKLIEKSKQGVKVRMLFDDVGCWKVPAGYFDQMREAGIEVYSFLEVRFHRLTSKINFRNHRKIVVIDGKTGYTGGMNIADRYWKGLEWGDWKDLHLRITGNGVEALQSAFLIDWYYVTKELLTLMNYLPTTPIKLSTVLPIQIVCGGPFGEWREVLHAYLKLIYTAKRYIYLQTPYFLPGESLLTALQTAALSGVEVRLMIPAKSDTIMVQRATNSYLKSVLKAGVKVYQYQQGFLHSKMIVSDDYISTVGSTNLDFRSFEHNFEINAFIYNRETAIQLKDIFLHDQNKCNRIILSQWEKRPLKTRFLESIIRLFSPLL